MASVIKNNLVAMNANRNLNVTTNLQSKSTQKLSSGYKINTAADDAAGLSISEKMRRQIRGLNQAAANAQDGISVVQTAEGALAEVTDMLQRMGELAVKGENETLKTADRQDIQKEVQALMSEIDRIQSTTTFNDQNLLDGSFTNKGLQVGAEATQHIAISVRDMSMAGLIKNADTGSLGGDVVGRSVGTTTANAAATYTMDSAKASAIVASFRQDTMQTSNIVKARAFASLNVFVKSALKSVSATRSDLGAVQNRLEHTIKNLNNIAENTQSAESAIRDTDMATEMVTFSNNNILAQAGTSMLAQANQSKQGILSLLG